MGVAFFGRYLLEREEIGEKQLRDGLELMYWVNRNIGELATAAGYMTPEDVEKIRQAQLASDKLFGELAIEAGLLKPGQIDELLQKQRTRQLRIGDALVELGYFCEARMAELLAAYQEEQRASGLRDASAPLTGWPLAQTILRMLPGYALRLGHLPVKIAEVRELDGEIPAEENARARLRIQGNDPIGIAFACAAPFASGLRAKEDRSECPPAEIARTFLHHLVTRVVSGAGLDPAQIVARDGFPTRGVCYELLSIRGKAHLVFELRF